MDEDGVVITVDLIGAEENEIEIPGLGLFINGEHVVSAEQLATYHALGRELPEGNVFTNPETVEVEVEETEEEPELEDPIAPLFALPSNPSTEVPDDNGDEE